MDTEVEEADEATRKDRVADPLHFRHISLRHHRLEFSHTSSGLSDQIMDRARIHVHRQATEHLLGVATKCRSVVYLHHKPFRLSLLNNRPASHCTGFEV